MPGEIQKALDRVETKTQVLFNRYALVISQRNDALARIDDLQRQVDDLKKQLQQLQTENEFLRVATTIAPERADVEHTRALLALMVKKIDKCIVELNE